MTQIRQIDCQFSPCGEAAGCCELLVSSRFPRHFTCLYDRQLPEWTEGSLSMFKRELIVNNTAACNPNSINLFLLL